jgi:hypothetical protein
MRRCRHYSKIVGHPHDASGVLAMSGLEFNREAAYRPIFSAVADVEDRMLCARTSRPGSRDLKDASTQHLAAQLAFV